MKTEYSEKKGTLTIKGLLGTLALQAVNDVVDMVHAKCLNHSSLAVEAESGLTGFLGGQGFEFQGPTRSSC